MATPFPTIPVSQSSSRTTSNDINVVRFGNGYEQRTPMGINYKRDHWNVTWDHVSTSQKNTIEAFIQSVSNGSVISWQSPLDTAEKAWVLEGDWTIQDSGGNVWAIQLALRQVYDLGEYYAPPPIDPEEPGGGTTYTPMALPTPIRATYWTGWSPNEGGQRIGVIPASYNQIYLFNAVPNGSSGAFKWEYYSAVNAAEIDAAHAKGQRVVLSCGGANARFYFETRSQSIAFVNSFVSMNTALGGKIDGIDFNTFEQMSSPASDNGVYPPLPDGSDNPAWDPIIAEMIWIAQQLRTRYGATFSVSAPPHPGRYYAPFDWKLMKAMVDANVLDYAAPQFYDSGDLIVPATIEEYITSWMAHLGTSHVGIGFGSNYVADAPNPTYTTTTAQARQVWSDLRPYNPTMAGVFGFSAQHDYEASTPWSWGAGMKAEMDLPYVAPPTIYSSAWLLPTVGAGGGWTTPGNILSSNDTRATRTLATAGEGGALFAYNFAGITSAIPVGATIKGFEVRIEGSQTGTPDYTYCFLTTGETYGTPLRSTLDKAIPLTGTEGTVILGSTTDTWGGVNNNGVAGKDREWLRTDLTSTLSVLMAFASSGTSLTTSIDAVALRISYTT